MSIDTGQEQAIFAGEALLPDGWAADVRIAIDGDGRIAAVAEGETAEPGDFRVPVLVPALSNLHSHTFQRGMAGLAETRSPAGRDSFWSWRETMYRFLDVLTPEDVEAIAAFAFMEMAEAGFGAVAEFHYLHNRPGGGSYDDPAELSSRIAAAAAETGLGLTLLPVYYRQGGVDGRPLNGGQLRFANDPESFDLLVRKAEKIVGALPGDTSLGIAPHSLRAVGPDDLAMLATMRPGLPLHMHIAEQTAEVDEMLAVRGARPVEWLLDNFEVDARWCLIHCTHMTSEETERLAASGAVAGLCPITEANLGDGIFAATDFMAAGGRFGVGTDSNVLIDAAGELRQLEYSQRLRDRVRVALAKPQGSAGRFLHDAALSGGAQALGRDSGAIAPGKWADLVALDPARLNSARGGDGHLDAWVFASRDGAVGELWSAGRHVVRQGRHVAREAIAARYRARLRQIASRL